MGFADSDFGEELSNEAWSVADNGFETIGTSGGGSEGLATGTAGTVGAIGGGKEGLLDKTGLVVGKSAKPLLALLPAKPEDEGCSMSVEPANCPEVVEVLAWDPPSAHEAAGERPPFCSKGDAGEMFDSGSAKFAQLSLETRLSTSVAPQSPQRSSDASGKETAGFIAKDDGPFDKACGLDCLREGSIGAMPLKVVWGGGGASAGGSINCAGAELGLEAGVATGPGCTFVPISAVDALSITVLASFSQ